MIDLSQISLVAIDGVGDDINTIKALKYSSKDIKFKDIIYITSGNYKPNFTNNTVNINKLSWNDYNKFCLTELCTYVDSDYLILIQSDGFIINPKKWNNDFLKYDYIGAPWPISNLSTNIFRWPMILNHVSSTKKLNQIGNGGFTLRSKKLLNYTSILYTDEMYSIPEDVIISLLLKDKLIELGLSFTDDISFASSFSCESKNIDGKILSSDNSFGFHCKDTHADKMSLLNTISIEEIL